MKSNWKLFDSLFVSFFILSFSAFILAQDELAALVKTIRPSVVVIYAYNKDGISVTQGTGFFITSEGSIITNYHVVENAKRIEIKTFDGSMYPILKVVVEDKISDLAQLQVDIPTDLVHPLAVTTSLPEAGDRVVVLGSPLGLEQSVSDGIVSAIRDLPGFGKIIQITAPISPGSSGSPVTNLAGDVLGVATLKIVEGENINFAIPGERISKLIKDVVIVSEHDASSENIASLSAQALYIRGFSCASNKEYHKAIVYLKEAIKKNPQHAWSFYELGVCYYGLEQYSSAVSGH